MIAVIETGGKQYIVKKGDIIKVEKIDRQKGEEVSFEKVLLAADKDSVKIGKPVLAESKVIGQVLAQKKGKKVWGIKHKPKKRYKIKFGHRQNYTEVKIVDISP